MPVFFVENCEKLLLFLSLFRLEISVYLVMHRRRKVLNIGGVGRGGGEGGPRFRKLGRGGGGARGCQIPSRHMTSY